MAASRLPMLTGLILCGAALGVVGLLANSGESIAASKPVALKPGAAPLNCGAGAFLPKSKLVSAVETTASGLKFQTVQPGTGAMPQRADYTLVGYKGSLTSGAVFDSNEKAAFPVAGVVPGFGEALVKMQKGGTYRICMPAALGYGARSPAPTIPANSVLRFEVSLIDFKSLADIEAMRREP
jgi:FKBP-type peptidyl-prolyl cis-trans isomerase FkpA